MLPIIKQDPVGALNFQVRFNVPGLLPGSRLLFFSSPLLSWSTNPALPSNLTTLQSLMTLDPLHLTDPFQRAPWCLHFFPGNLSFATECRLLTLGTGTRWGMAACIGARSDGSWHGCHRASGHARHAEPGSMCRSMLAG